MSGKGAKVNYTVMQTKVSGCVGASRRKVANERVVRGKT